jgi:hypothetical protein
MAAGLEASRTPIQNQWRFRATDPLTEKRPVDLNIVLDVVLDGAESASVARLRRSGNPRIPESRSTRNSLK